MAQLIDETKTRKCDACKGSKLNEHGDDACGICHGHGFVPAKNAVVMDTDDPHKLVKKLASLDEPSKYRVEGVDAAALPSPDAKE